MTPTYTVTMNFLAHLFLASPDTDCMLGSLAADFVRSREIAGFPDTIQAGIRLHQRIDSFTDAHPVVAASKRRLHPPYRRFAGVLLDIFYDHYLAVRWGQYSPSTILEVFAQQVYRVLEQKQSMLPDRLRRMSPRMIEEDWLVSYRNIEEIDRSLKRLSQRIRRENPLGDGVALLRTRYDEFESDFESFFPDLMEFTQRDGKGCRRPRRAGRPSW